MKKNILICAMLLSIPAVSFTADQAGLKVTASSFEKDLTKPGNAADGNMQTRWASQFADPQWLQLDFGNPKEICGILINWEAAYGKTYDVQVSQNGSKWKTVYTVVDGDGSTDDIFFAKTKTRFLRILGKERGTSWGYSIWELKVKGFEEAPEFKASSKAGDSTPDKVMDGSFNASWKSGNGKEEWLSIVLKTAKEVGGFELYWGKNFPREYEILGLKDSEWQQIYSTAKGNGGKDLIYIDKSRIDGVKIVAKKSSGAGFELKEMMLKGPDEAATPQRMFELAAMESVKGYYPRWLVKQQTYWTVVGVDKDSNETLFSEDGGIEPFFHSFSIQPFIYTNNSLISYEQVDVTQSLEKGYLPIPAVTWEAKNLVFNQKIFAAGETGKSGSYVRYSIENISPYEVSGKLFVAIRPFQINPPWQYGGLSEIKSLRYDKTLFATVFVNEAAGIVSFSEPSGFGAQKTEDGEIVETLQSGELPAAAEVSDARKYASGALEYDFTIPSGQVQEYFFYVPMGKESEYGLPPGDKPMSEFFDEILTDNIRAWETRLKTVQIKIPEQGIIDAMKTHLAYILINRDGPLVQPGPRNYQRSWMRDGAIINAALLRSGFAAEAREYVDYMVTMQKPDGFVPFMIEVNKMPDWAKGWTEYDSQGEFVYAIMECYRFTHDKKMLKDYMPAAKKSLEYIAALRNKRLTAEFKDGPDDKKKYYGLVPESNSHEGYFPAVHSYWDDFFTLKGWKDGAEMAGIIGDSKVAKWADGQAQDLQKTFYNSMYLVMKLKDLDTLPASADYGDFDPTSTSIGIFPCDELENMPHPQTETTFNKYYKDTFMPKLKSNWKGGYTPYEQRNALSFLIMGQKDKALAMVRHFVSASRPRAWNELAEVVFDNYRHPQYIGDMPHTWISAEVVSTIRSLFIYENKDTLELAKGVDIAWLRSKDGVSVKEMPTYWGAVSYSARIGGKVFQASVSGDANPPKGFVFVLSDIKKVKELKINGQSVKVSADGMIVFDKLPAEITAVLERK
ncbi:MAG: discoidin domain-containing protein [Elusimicrobiota bacterium]